MALVKDERAPDTYAMSIDTSLQKQFLVAMPGLQDSHFDRSVTLLCQHNDEGALGLVVNRPTDLRLSTMLDHVDVAHDKLPDDPIVYWGGPVSPERGFVLHGKPGDWDSCMKIEDDLYLTTSRDVLSALGRGDGPREFLITLGYAGWGSGQLEQELLDNAWLNTPLSRQILFGLPAAERWLAATQLLGLDISHLASQAGHA